MEIRKARRSDVEKILDVINKTERKAYSDIVPQESFEDPFLTLEEMEEIFEDMMFYVAVMKEKIVGVAALKVVDESEGRIRWVYVRPEFQRQEIGTSLMKKIEEVSKRKDLEELFAYYVSKKATWAKEFYSSLGYEISGEIDHAHGECFIFGKEIR